jgi:trehalose 6-phosphate phosphatase
LGSETRLQIAQFLETVAVAPARLLMLDYDGTIAPIRRERDQVYPYPGIAPIVKEIASVARTRVVIVSGRDVNELVPRVGIQPIPELWGSHGLQRRRLDGTVETARVEQRYLDALSDAARWLEYQRLRSIAEFKTGSIAAHWRGLSDGEAEEVRARVLLGWEPIAKGNALQVLEFNGGVEIRAPAADKGDVVRILLREEGPDTAAAYLGDDSSDESAFRAIRGRGLSILVRPERRPTAAQVWLKPPDEVLGFFKQWLAACRRGDAKCGAPVVAAKGRG